MSRPPDREVPDWLRQIVDDARHDNGLQDALRDLVWRGYRQAMIDTIQQLWRLGGEAEAVPTRTIMIALLEATDQLEMSRADIVRAIAAEDPVAAHRFAERFAVT